MSERPGIPQELFRRRVSRRDVLRMAGLGAGTLGLSAVLAACSSGGSSGQAATKSVWDTAKKAGELRFANWPLYIDQAKKNGQTVYPSLSLFERKYGIDLSYEEVISGDPEFFATLQPLYRSGQNTGWDLYESSDWMVAKLIHLGYLTPLEKSYLADFEKNVGPDVRSPNYDPGSKFSVAWQSGLTGIGYNPKLTGREITSYWDLYDPKFAGHVGMLNDIRDLPSLAMVAMGVDLDTSTPADWRKAAETLTKQRDDGIVRQYYDQSYIGALRNGDTWISMAWSGDVFQSQLNGYPDLQFVIPTEGGLLWTGALVIPERAAHPVDAITYMNFIYQPKVAAMMTEWINYITPVPASRDVILQDAAAATSSATHDYLMKVADSFAVFPSADVLANTHRYRLLTDPAEEQEWNSIFEPIYQS